MSLLGLKQVKNLKSEPITLADIKIDAVFKINSGLGGVFNIVCTKISNDTAHFKNTCPDWPYTYTLDFNETSLTDAELLKLPSLITSTGFIKLTAKEAALVRSAARVGLIHIASYTQVNLTEYGMQELDKIKSA